MKNKINILIFFLILTSFCFASSSVFIDETGATKILVGNVVNTVNGQTGDITISTSTITGFATLSTNTFTGLQTIENDLDVTGDIKISSDKAFYFGDKDEEGSWRYIRVGDNLEIQKREGSTWNKTGYYSL